MNQPKLNIGGGLSASPTASPRVSVLIVDRDRRIYLQEALDSVLAQDVDSHLLEIIVAKGYADARLEKHLDSIGVRHVTVHGGALGRLWVTGAKASRGDLIAFLDDDDLFHSGKISRVLAVFQSHPGLTYYHNSSIRIDEHLAVLDKQVVLPKSSKYIQTENATPDEILSIYMQHPMSSSFLCISRPVLERYSDFIDRTASVIDHVALALSLAYGGGLFLDSEVLTYYRVHRSSTTHSPSTPPDGSTRLEEFYQSGAATLGKLTEFLEDSSKSELPLFFCRALLSTFSAKAQIISSRKQKDWKILRALTALAVRYRHPEFVSLALLYSLHILFPKVSAQVFRAIRRAYLSGQNPSLGGRA